MARSRTVRRERNVGLASVERASVLLELKHAEGNWRRGLGFAMAVVR